MPRPAVPQPLGARMKAARIAAGYASARAAAAAIGMHEAAYRDAEAGKDARFSTLAQIIEGLRIDPRAIFPEWNAPRRGRRSV